MFEIELLKHYKLWILNACNRDQRSFLKFQHEIIKIIPDIILELFGEQRNISLNFCRLIELFMKFCQVRFPAGPKIYLSYNTT